MAFTWSEFVTGLNASNVASTLTNATYDNVQLRIKLGGPLASAWQYSGHATLVNNQYGNQDASTYEAPTSMKLLGNNSPDLDTAPGTNLYSVPSYQGLVDSHTAVDGFGNFFGLYADYNNADQEFALKGIAGSGNYNQLTFQSNSAAYTTAVFFEVGFETNPSSAHTANGYPGYYFYWPFTGGSLTSGGYVDVEEFRHGFVASGTSIADPAFDGTNMMYGLWVKKNGSNYDVKLITNGAVVVSASVPFTVGINSAQISPTTTGSPATMLDGQMPMRNQASLVTDLHTWADVGAGDMGYDYTATWQAINILNTKYGMYVKPNASNAVAFHLFDSFGLVTNPAMTPFSSGTAFWQSKVKCTESDA